jgi:hypothetical protein
LKTFLTGFFQVFFVAVNTILLVEGYILGVFMASFTISMLWCYNVAKISVSTLISKIIYSLGAGLGAVFGYLFADALIIYLLMY